MSHTLDVFEIDTCAAAAHEVNRIYAGSLGEALEVHWEDLPAERQQVARLSVVGIITYGHNPAQSHKDWMEYKMSQGWKHGDIKDIEKKVHPCLTAFEKLPFEIQHKDTLWVVTVKIMYDSLWRKPAQ